jgi:hypothetical protein
MSEINEVKRLYEKEVKLGYNKLTNGDKVQQATNIDDALREWQVQQAKDLGFTNIDELNKQTQLSKFLINKLGDRIVGKASSNGMDLSDWIVLSGGNPASIAGFLTKKFFSSAIIQAKTAELLSGGQKTGQITPKTEVTPANIERQVSPQGLKQLPEGTSKTAENKVPIELRGEYTQEKGVPKTSTQVEQPKLEKSQSTSSKSTTSTAKVKKAIGNFLENSNKTEDQIIKEISKKFNISKDKVAKLIDKMTD